MTVSEFIASGVVTATGLSAVELIKARLAHRTKVKEESAELRVKQIDSRDAWVQDLLDRETNLLKRQDELEHENFEQARLIADLRLKVSEIKGQHQQCEIEQRILRREIDGLKQSSLRMEERTKKCEEQLAKGRSVI